MIILKEKPMKIIISILFILLGVIIMSYTKLVAAKETGMEGTIIYSVPAYSTLGHSIFSMNLSDFSSNQISTPREQYFYSLSKIGDKKFLFDDSIDTNKSYINEFNIETGEIKKIIKGGYPFYMATHKKLFFVSSESNDKQSFFYVVDYNSHIQENKPITVGLTGSVIERPIQVSDDEVIFSNANKPGEIIMYNVVTNQSKILPIQNCDHPYIWRSATKQLLCRNTKTLYFLVGLDGKNIEKIEFSFDDSAVSANMYLPKYDKLLFNRREAFFLTEHDNLWLYDFKTKTKQRVLKATGIGDSFLNL